MDTISAPKAEVRLGSDLSTWVIDLRQQATAIVVETDHVIDALLDLRNLGAAIDLGLTFTVDELLQSVPRATMVSTEWWHTALTELADYASFLGT